MRILLCTLGASWAVIPEVLGWLAPQVLDLYAHHPQRDQLDALRERHGLFAPDEIWVCSTEGAQTQASRELLLQWWRRLDAAPALRIWTAAGTDQLASQDECARFRELCLRTALRAHERAAGGQVILSLAGGRKTMSADLQHAGNILGADALLHVVGPEPLPKGLREPAIETLLQPLPRELAAGVMPLVVGAGTHSELLDIDDGAGTISSARFPLPLASPGQPISWCCPSGRQPLLQDELERRQRESSSLLGNYLATLAQQERHDNWRSLYRLPAAQIERLRSTQLAPGHLRLLSQLPKADLHRHLGGCLDIAAQRKVARAIWDALAPGERATGLRLVTPLLQQHDWPWEWSSRLRQAPAGVQRSTLSAALLLHASDAQLEHNLYQVTEPRIALRSRAPHGFAAYERPGELSGSALLADRAALEPYAQAVLAQAHDESLTYLELRGSPHKYRPEDPAGFVADLRHALDRAPQNVVVRFIWILDRRQRDSLPRVVRQAVEARRAVGDFLVGLDLAGDEGSTDPEQLAPAFTGAFAECMPLTIHAGEGEAAANIWQAAYHLHADRIGHGLTLADHPQLLARFRDRGICLELCPTSNREVVGYRDPAHPGTEHLSAYPLRGFLDAGLSVTLCTDNPGISRTTLAQEYLGAARMTTGGLTLWETLMLMRQSLVHAFLPSAHREQLLKRADAQVYQIFSNPAHPATP